MPTARKSRSGQSNSAGGVLVNPGSSFACSNDPRVHVGLGTIERVDAIEVLWPDGLKETFPGCAVDQHLILKRGTSPNSPMTNSPMTNSPMTNSPMTNSPMTNSPMTNSPMTNSPMTKDSKKTGVWSLVIGKLVIGKLVIGIWGAAGLTLLVLATPVFMVGLQPTGTNAFAGHRAGTAWSAPVVEVISRALERVRRDPRSGTAWGHLGEVLGIHAQNQQALECFAEASRLDSNEPRWPYRLGLYLSILEDPEKALPHLRRAVELLDRFEPSNNVPRLLLAETLLELRQMEEAEAILGTVARAEPDNARVHHDLGLLALAQNQGVAAEEHLIRALASPYAHKKACAQLARLYQQQGKETVAADFLSPCRRAAHRPPLAGPL